MAEVVMQACKQNSSGSSATNVAWCVMAGALSLVASAECSAQVLSDPQRAWRPDPQQRVALTLDTQVVHQPLSWQPRGGNPDLQGSATTQATLGLEFRRKSPAQSYKDLLRVQLTADSMLNFRPRGGGLVVTYRSTF
jgi:hypothetical protein